MKKKMMFALIVILFECLMIFLAGCDLGLSKQEVKDKTKEIASPIADGLYDVVTDTIAKKTEEKMKTNTEISTATDTGTEVWTNEETVKAEEVTKEMNAPKADFDPNIIMLKNIDTSDFNPAMFPSYEQLISCQTEFKINISGKSLDWNAFNQGLNLNPNDGENVKVVEFWFLENGKCIAWKDWGYDCPPRGDDRWYNTEDLRKDHVKINALEVSGSHIIVCLVGTWQPRGANDVSRVIARSKIF